MFGMCIGLARSSSERPLMLTILRCGLRELPFVAPNVELSGPRRQDARPGLAKMYRVPPDRAWWPAVGAPLERRVRRQLRDSLGFCAITVAKSFECFREEKLMSL